MPKIDTGLTRTIRREGSILNDLMVQYGLKQIIHEPTHVLKSSVSCIDLLFGCQENLVTNSGVHSPLHPKGRYTYDVHENCPIFKTPRPHPTPCPATSKILPLPWP